MLCNSINYNKINIRAENSTTRSSWFFIYIKSTLCKGLHTHTHMPRFIFVDHIRVEMRVYVCARNAKCKYANVSKNLSTKSETQDLWSQESAERSRWLTIPKKDIHFPNERTHTHTLVIMYGGSLSFRLVKILFCSGSPFQSALTISLSLSPYLFSFVRFSDSHSAVCAITTFFSIFTSLWYTIQLHIHTPKD